jgi:hypothetical protein
MAGEKAATLKILGNNLDAKEKLKQIKEEADQLRADNPELTVKINRAQAAAEMAILKAELGKPIQVPLDVDPLDAFASMAAAKDALGSPIALTAEDTQALAALDSLGLKIDELKATRAKISLDLNDKAAVAKVAALDVQLDALDRKRSDPKVAVSGMAKALADVASLDLALDGLSKKKVNPFKGIDLTGLGSGALWGGGIAAAAGPGAAAVGVLSAGVLGLGAALVPAVAGLGLFGAVVKTGITDVETADKKNKTLTGGLGELQTSVKAASSAWTSFTSNALKDGAASTMAKSIGLIPIALRQVQPLLAPVEKALDGIIGKLGNGLNSSGFTNFIGVLSANAGPSITKLAGIFGHLGSMVGKVVIAFQPLGQTVLSDVDKLLGKADAGTNSGLQKFLNWVSANGPEVMGILKNLGTAVGNMGKSFVGLGQLDLPAFAAIASFLATVSKNPIGAGVLVGLLTLVKVGSAVGPMVKLVGAFKELSGVINLTKIAAIGLDAVPIVLVISLIVVAIVLLITHWNTVKKVAGDVWHWITKVASDAFNWIKKNWPLLLGIILGPIALAVALVVTHFKQISHFAETVVSDIGKFFGKAKTLVLNAFKDAGSWLVNAGKDIVMGAVHGIESGFDKITSTIGHLTSLIPDTFKKLLGIFSPSKVMQTLATQVPNGIVAGFSGSTSQIQSAAGKLTTAIKTAFTNGLIGEGKYSSLTNYINNDTNKLKTLATQRTAIANQIKAADSYAASVSATAAGTASLSTIGGNLTANGGIVTGTGIISGLQSGLAQINKFSADITKLRKAGLNKNLLDQIIQMGPVDGTQYADALLSGGIAQIKQANGLETAINQASSNLGASAANAMYDTGKQAGKGFLTGLSSQEKAITAEMSKIGNSMVTTIKKDLGIHSPSRVMTVIGGNIADGVTLGISTNASKAIRASQSMVSAIANPKVSTRSLGSAGNSGGLTAEWVGGSGADQEFISWLKKNIRIRGGDPSVLGR